MIGGAFGRVDAVDFDRVDQVSTEWAGAERQLRAFAAR